LIKDHVLQLFNLSSEFFTFDGCLDMKKGAFFFGLLKRRCCRWVWKIVSEQWYFWYYAYILGLIIIFVPVSLRFFGFNLCIFFCCKLVLVCSNLLVLVPKLKFARKSVGNQWIFLQILVLGTKIKKRFVHAWTNLQQKKIHGRKPKIYELTGTKMMFKPIF
jgi:hypothetical protein